MVPARAARNQWIVAAGAVAAIGLSLIAAFLTPAFIIAGLPFIDGIAAYDLPDLPDSDSHASA
jgi:hypothetical protein